jgi:outer membrane protein assembly factor BamE (lipoprotein component of BamABCDE complex)
LRASQRLRHIQRSLPAALVAAGLALALGACEQTVQVRGNMPLEEDLAQINPGVHSRNDVARLLGSPSAISTFQDSKWYYIGQKTSDFAFFAPEVLERKVVVVSFDNTGNVAQTETLTLADSQDIDPIDRKTPTEGKELTFLQQIFGNLGRFSGSVGGDTP